MRIRLIQPPLVQPRYRQLTLPVVGAELAAQGLEVEVCDENVEPLERSPDPDLVGISCHVYNAPRTFEIARGFRQRGVPVIIGGTFPTVAPHLVAPHCDAVLVGELEGQAAELVADARARRLKPLYQAAAPPSLAHTVLPDLSLLDSSNYLRFNFPLELSRGCRFNCHFCTTNRLYPTARTRSLANIERDLSQYDHGQVEIIDVNFLNDAAHLKEVLPILRAAPVPGWFGQTTVADLDRDPSLPRMLARSRCRAVFVGLETVAHQGLRNINKAWSRPAAFVRAAERLRGEGVLVQAGLIVGLDSDSAELYARTVELLEQAQVQTASITFLHHYPGTEPYQRLWQAGRLGTDDWRALDGNQPTIRPLGLSIPQLQRQVRRMLQQLYSPGSITRRALHRGMLRRPSQLVHHLTLNLALRSYYQQLLTHSETRSAEALYMGGPPRDDKTERWMADTSSRLLEWLWS